MVHHYITKYRENGQKYAEAWIQINLFSASLCLWRKKIAL